MSKHAAPWSPVRIFSDMLIGRTYPGKHHPLWSGGWFETPGGGLIHPIRLDAAARALVGTSA